MNAGRTAGPIATAASMVTIPVCGPTVRSPAATRAAAGVVVPVLFADDRKPLLDAAPVEPMIIFAFELAGFPDHNIKIFFVPGAIQAPESIVPIVASNEMVPSALLLRSVAAAELTTMFPNASVSVKS